MRDKKRERLELAEKLIERQMMYDFAKQLATHQSAPIQNGERFILNGSGITALNGVEHFDLAPKRRMASDLDIIFYEPESHQESYEERNAKFVRHKEFFSGIAESLGASCRFNDREHYEGDCEAVVTRKMSRSEVRELLERPHNMQMLKAHLSDRDIRQLMEADLPETLSASYSLHYGMFQVGLAKPQPLTFMVDDPAKSNLLVDNPYNLLSLKLARLLLPPYDSRGMGIGRGHKKYEKATDFQDISDNLHLLQAQGDSIEPRLLRFMTICMMGLIEGRKNLSEASLQRLNPDFSEFTLGGGDGLPFNPSNLQRVSYELGRDRYALDSISRPPQWIHESMSSTFDLAKQVFPEAAVNQPISLTAVEEGLVNAMACYPGEKRVQRVSAALQAAESEYADVFSRHPDLKQSILTLRATEPEFSPETVKRWSEPDTPDALFLG